MQLLVKLRKQDQEQNLNDALRMLAVILAPQKTFLMGIKVSMQTYPGGSILSQFFLSKEGSKALSYIHVRLQI